MTGSLGTSATGGGGGGAVDTDVELGTSGTCPGGGGAGGGGPPDTVVSCVVVAGCCCWLESNFKSFSSSTELSCYSQDQKS